MSQLDPLKTFADLVLGARVDKAAFQHTGSAAAVAVFNIKGGRVAIRALIGEITIAASGATNLQLQSNPTTGTTAVMSTVLAAGALEQYTLMSITGAVGDAMYGVSAGLAQGGIRDTIIVPIGVIELTSSAAETITTKWSVFYVPIDDGAYMESA